MFIDVKYAFCGVQSKSSIYCCFIKDIPAFRVNSNVRSYIRMSYMKREKKDMCNMWKRMRKVEDESLE
jgi:hypothetical protein